MSTGMMTNEQVAATIHAALEPLGIVPMDSELPDEPSVADLRRYRRTRFDDPVGVVTLLDIDGVLVWEPGAVNSTTSSVRRRRGGTASDGTVVTQLKYTKALGLNEITERLTKLDGVLTPAGPAGLLAYDRRSGLATSGAVPVDKGRILLFIHGTFSRTERVVEQLRSSLAVEGQFFNKLDAYDQILGFDHYTLSRTPVVNAVALARAFATSTAAIDIVCHSRGGLVARWFCEMLDRHADRERRVVFVGCPLRGTSLADPQSLRNGLNLLTNVGRLIGETGQLIPLLTAAGGLIQIVSSVGGFAARTPAVDAGVGLIPGLAAMSRITNNGELETLNSAPPPAHSKYFAVTSNFTTDALGWRFWRVFTKAKAADIAADYLVFNQDNDLVVDTESMTFHAFGPAPNVANDKMFRCFQGGDVHHTNYFQHPETAGFLAQAFRL